MKSQSSTEKNGLANRLATLRQREQALKQAIAAENIKHQRREHKIRARLVSIVGEVLLAKATSTPDFDLMLRQILKGSDLDSHHRQFLLRIGWL